MQGSALFYSSVAARGSTQDWISHYFHFAKGLADYRLGRLDSARAEMNGEASRVLGPAPRLVLALAQHDYGQKKQARQTLARAIVSFDWSPTQADSRDIWICHILRREAEALILPNLPAFLEGKYEPLDTAERLALVGVCRFQDRCHAAARLYADAFSADPALVEDLIAECCRRATLGDQQPVGRVEELATSCRYPAARCAALAGCGLGKDAAPLSTAERAHWRKQAREWLHADLSVWAKLLHGHSPAARIMARKMLIQWQTDPDLAGLREPHALGKFSEVERRECRALWQAVAAALQSS
jgi:serine/threonine-protein kinase